MSLERIAATLRETAGLEAESLGVRHLADAVRKLMAKADVGTDGYADLLTVDARARERLIGELLVHETSFFRYPASFSDLASHAVGCASARPGPVRVLSAACATGQEAYSAAITLLEAGLPASRVSIDAFDRSGSAIEFAQRGRYDRGGTRGLDAERATRWFESRDGGLSVVSDVRALVHFETGSLLASDRPFANVIYDAILCRNLLIYLTEPARRRALAAIRASLSPDGVLYLGHAEVLVARAEGFTPRGGAGVYACVAGRGEVPRSKGSASRERRPAATNPVPMPVSSTVAKPRSAVPTETNVLRDARDLADAGRLAEACALLEAEVTCGQPGADHFHLLALVRRAAGKAHEADEALGRALYLDPSHVGALLLAAVSAEGRGERHVAARLNARARAVVEGKS